MSDHIGTIVDSLGVRLRVEQGEMVTDVVLIAKVVEADGTVRCGLAWSEGMSWIERLGMVTAAKAIEMPSPAELDEG